MSNVKRPTFGWYSNCQKGGYHYCSEHIYVIRVLIPLITARSILYSDDVYTFVDRIQSIHAGCSLSIDDYIHFDPEPLLLA